MIQTEADVLVSALSLAAAVWHQLCHFLTFSCSFTADFGSGLTLVPLQHLLHLEIHPLFYYLFSLAWDSSLFLFLLFYFFFPQETNSESNHKTVIPGSTKFKPGRICVLECCSSPSLTSLTPLPRCVLTHAQAYPTGKWQGAARGNGLQRYKTLHSVSQGMDEVEEEVPNPKQTLHVHLWLCTHSSLNLQETKSRWEAQLDKAAWIFTLLHANDGTWARV